MRSRARLVLLTSACFALLLLVAPTAVADKPILKVEDAVVEATGPSGAAVTYKITATDDNGPPTVTCQPADGSTFPLGKTQAKCTAVDTVTGQSATATFQVTVRDTTPPTITVPSGATAEATGPSGATVTYSTSAFDTVSGALTPSCDKPSGSSFALGQTTVTCTATDAAGRTASAAFAVTVKDTTPPVVIVPGDVSAEATGSSGATVTYAGVSASDAVSGALTPTCDRASGSTFPLGSTTVSCSASDGSGNKGSAGFTVTVKDTKPPTITVPSGITAEATGPSGASATYAVSATDTVSGSLTPSCDRSSGSTFPVGATTVSCTATDGSGNSASATFIVTVKDTKPPTITVPSGVTAEATEAAGAQVTYTVSAKDTVSGSVTPRCDRASGSKFPLGVTTVSCTATDASGNSASASFKVTVQDTKPPTLTVPSGVTAEATNASGAVVNYTVTGTDAVSGTVTPSCDKASGSVFPLGTTTVKCKATDGAGNSASESFGVTVKDTTPPAFKTLPGDVVAEAVDSGGSTVTYAGATAVDAVDGAILPSCAPASGSKFPIGTTTVSCRATDSRGNSRSASFFVAVVDTTPPVLTVPGPITVSSQGGESVATSAAAIAAFLGGATARDIIDGALPVTNDAQAVFGLGTTTVTFAATDKAGNSVTSRSTVTVVKEAVPPTAPLDRTPPDDVRGLRARAGVGNVTLNWQRPGAPDFDHVVILRSTRTSTERPVYTGASLRYVDRSLTGGVDYRYVVVTYDHAGNRSAGVAALAAPKALMLLSPADGARLTRPPLLRWVHVEGASYYNVQLLLGNVKVLSAWLTATQLQLSSRWVYAGRHRRLAQGFYRWYVFPGFGPRSANKYGPTLGGSTFWVVAGK